MLGTLVPPTAGGSDPTVPRRLPPFLAALFLLLGASPAFAENGRFTIIEENDSLFFNSDKHYTQGLRLSYLGPELAPDGWASSSFEALGFVMPWLGADASARSRRLAIIVGQSLFTPKETDLRPPDPADRPYAGWLYGGVSLLQETDHRILDHIELQLGIVGPGAAGKATQNEWHQFIGVTEARGWGSQVQNEVGGLIEVERKWRIGLVGDPSAGVDIVPEVGGVAGNVFTYGKTGALLRIGTNLGGDYGPVRVTPGLSGTDYADTRAFGQGLGFYAFVGAEGRAVGRNIFLDGNSFRQSRSVDKKILVGDLQAGFSAFWSDRLRLDAMVVRRSPEFEGQGSPDIVGMVGLSLFW
jgi:hypothetical protein